jgi:arsenate reductase (thioredoxin)
MKPIDVLFLCETNAATSLIAEALVNHRDDPRFRAFSAGRMPARTVLPEAREALVARGIDAEALAPKPWSIFALPGARRPDLVVDLAAVTWTLTDTTGFVEDADIHRGWRLSKGLVHWPLRDPSLIAGRAERRAVAEKVLENLEDRLTEQLFASNVLGREADYSATQVPARPATIA